MRIVPIFLALFMHFSVGTGASNGESPPRQDLFSDTWVATDGLGRSLPTHNQVGGPRNDRSVGIFYFLWLSKPFEDGPYDISKILADSPDALNHPENPRWGPPGSYHHWGEPLFSYYRTRDEFVLRKHAQMLADAGVDTVIFDVTNQLTYPDEYRTLLKVWAEMRELGNETPAVAFLTPFWSPDKVVRELWKDLYQPGHYADLWYRWEGKPLILADPALLSNRRRHDRATTAVKLTTNQTLGQSFTAKKPFTSIGACVPTWNTGDSKLTLCLRSDGPNGKIIAQKEFVKITDNAWLHLNAKQAQPPGLYYLEMSDPTGSVGWWSDPIKTLPSGTAYLNGKVVPGARAIEFTPEDPDTKNLKKFFTFRKPQPDYFQGPTQPNMWSWLEVHPQHIFRNAAGQKEQMSVSVAQNAVNGRLAALSHPGAQGRTYHHGSRDLNPDAVRLGPNFQEQWNRALKEDPHFIFVTSWNEWVAGRWNDFGGVRHPLTFVDQYDHEFSRDVEPMQGGHGDDYYYQLISNIRRYKGVRTVSSVTSQPITIDGRFDDWEKVSPEFRDTRGDPVRRQHPTWDKKGTHLNKTGRHDLVSSKVSHSKGTLYFQVETAAPLSVGVNQNWMLLFLDLDTDPNTGWLGYDLVVNRKVDLKTGTTSVERHNKDYRWNRGQRVHLAISGNQLELALPLKLLGLKKLPKEIHFKWADNIQHTGSWSDFTLNGDAAPNDRFNYRAVFESQ